MESLIHFDKENIGEANLKAIQPYLDNKEFEPDLIRTKSFAAAGLCSWCINIVTFYRVFCDVEPKRRALAQANAELDAAQKKLAKIKEKIKVRAWMLGSLMVVGECELEPMGTDLWVVHTCAQNKLCILLQVLYSHTVLPAAS